jgi:hypothetical protein
MISMSFAKLPLEGVATADIIPNLNTRKAPILMEQFANIDANFVGLDKVLVQTGSHMVRDLAVGDKAILSILKPLNKIHFHSPFDLFPLEVSLL